MVFVCHQMGRPIWRRRMAPSLSALPLQRLPEIPEGCSTASRQSISIMEI